MEYLITGANGQLGQEVTNLLRSQKKSVSAYGSKELNILDKDKIEYVFNEENPEVVFHCAAYTAVDKAEDDKNQNWNINVEGTKNIAEACKKHNTLMIYISTDYVFDGKGTETYKETDTPNPQNEYGKAKLEGEKAVQTILDEHYIIRTSWVFGEYGNNFVSTMKRLADEKSELSIVSDQIGRPTWTKTLAEFMIHLTKVKPEYGIYHLSNDESCSWFEFAEEILKNKDILVRQILSEDYPQKATRPKHSVLNLSKAKATGFDILDWKTALNQFNQSLN